MSLISSIQLANNALKATQIGLQVVGQNIANVNTPGYIREEMILTPAPTQRLGGVLLGLGVQVTGVVQKIDKFLEDRLRSAMSDRTSAESQEKTYLQLEQLIGELSDTDLSTSLSNFFSSISEVLNQPESASVRNLAVLQGMTLTTDINRLANRVSNLSSDVNKRVANIAADINRLTDEIASLNVRIAEVEGGGALNSDAVGLRDQRGVALANLAKLIDVRTDEQLNGSVAVFVEGNYLVLEGFRREIVVKQESVNGMPRAELRIAGIDSLLKPGGGELAGLTASRDDILGGFLDDLNEFSRTLIFEFNKLYSRGQGLQGFTEVKSEFIVDNTSAPLDAAGLSYTPVNGSFELLVLNKQTGLTQTTQIRVDLDGLDDDITLDRLVKQLDAVNGISASLDNTNRLFIKATSPDAEFAFANDTSGVLAALGINTFFTGTSSQSMGVSGEVRKDPAKFAASSGGIGEDTQNAVELAAFLDRPLRTQNGSTISVLYDRMTSKTTQGSTVARAVAEGFRVFEQTLHGESLAISGVSLDEEAVKLMTYQLAYQASAKYISTLAQLLEVLVNL